MVTGLGVMPGHVYGPKSSRGGRFSKAVKRRLRLIFEKSKRGTTQRKSHGSKVQDARKMGVWISMKRGLGKIVRPRRA